MRDKAVKATILIPVLFWIVSFGPGASPAGAAAESSYNELVNEASGNALSKDLPQKSIITRPVVEYKADNLRDPFEDFLPKKISAQGQGGDAVDEAIVSRLKALQVQGLIWGSQMPQAIVNNKVIRVGDSLEGGLVADINKKGITLKIGEKEYNLGPPAAGVVPSNKDPLLGP